MKSIYIAVATIIGLSLIFMSLKTTSSDPESRKDKWAKIESNIQRRVEPKTTLKLCKALLKEITADKASDEWAKAKVYIHHLTLMTSDDTDNLNQKLLTDIETDIKSAGFPERNYMSAIANKLVSKYMRNHKWEIENRKNDDYNPKDFTTWKMDHFKEKLAEYKKDMFDNASGLSDISIENASALFMHSDKKKAFIKTVHQALWYLELSNQKQNLYEANLSAIDIEDAFTGTSEKEALNTYLTDFETYKNLFNSKETAQKLEMELWAHLISLKQTSKIDEIYINNLVAVNTHSSRVLEAEKNYRIALYYYGKANALNPDQLNDLDAIKEVKQAKTKQLNLAVSYLNKIEVKEEANNALLNEITQKADQLTTHITVGESININGKASYLSNQDLLFSLNSRNIKDLDLEVYKLDVEEYIEKNKTLNWKERDKILNHLNKKTKVWNGHYSIDYTSDYIEDKRQIVVPKLDYGFYALAQKGHPEHYKIFQVSDLFVSTNDKKIFVKSAVDYSVVDNAVLHLEIGTNKTKKFNDKGVLVFTSKKQSNLMVKSGEDTYLLLNQYFYGYSNDYSNRSHDVNQIFIDRAIYRPGQKVQIKVQQKSKKEKDVLYALSNNTKTTLRFYDSQHQLIEEKTIRLNEFSSGNTSFIIPEGLVNGQFYIQSDNGSKYFRVEEYKRPTFYVDFEKDSTEKQIGDIIKLPILAKTFSGINLANAKVEYTIKYSNVPRYFWRCGYYNWSQEYVLLNSKNTLGKDGKYEIEINTNDIPESMKENDLVRFTIEAKIVDINGDSETETTQFTLSKEGLTLQDFGDKKQMESEGLDVFGGLNNFQGLPIEKSIQYTISELEQPSNIYFGNRNQFDRPLLLADGVKNTSGLEHYSILQEGKIQHWKVKSNIGSGSFTSNTTHTFKEKLEAGVYKVNYSTKDKFENEITKEQFITVYPKKKKNTPKSEDIFISTNQNKYKVKDNFKALVYLPFESEYHYVLSDFNGVIASGVVKGNDVLKINESIEERSKGGLILDIKTVYKNHVYKQSQLFDVDWDLDLQTKWVSINNKIQPQTVQEWKLEVSHHNKPVETTEVLAFMYDASLDEIAKHNISDLMDRKDTYHYSKYLNASQLISRMSSQFNQNSHIGNTSISGLKGIQFVAGLNRVSLENNGGRYYIDGIKVTPEMMESDVAYEDVDPGSMAGFYAINNEKSLSERRGRSKKRKKSSSRFSSRSSSEKQISSDQEKSKSTQIRKNFQETIFFYPELLTNEKGEVSIPFTMSDGMGKFKLMMYGYTKDLKQFYVEEDIVSNKELMAEMHKPRFLYSGDEMIWTSKISNLSKETQNAKVQLKLTDALNQSMIFDSGNGSKMLSLTSGGSQKVEWKVKVPEHFVGEIKYELRAETDKFVDVEIDQIPVLTTQTLINENFALTIGGNASKTYKLANIINAENFEQFRIECMAYPIWQVIKALPYSKSTDDKIISNLLDEYVTIKIGQHILAKNPKISEKLLALSKTNQTSVLKDKQELKAITLEESPWVADAKNQEEEMRQLANFFDRNQLMNRLKTLERKITKHQSKAGGFSWIKGGKDSYWMSLYVAKSLSNLEKLGLAKDDLKPLKTNLFTYLDLEVLDQYNKAKAKGFLKNTKVSHVDYLNVRAVFLNDYSVVKKARVAYDFYLEKSLEHWSDASFVNRIALAKVAHGNGNLKIADDIFKTLDEYKLENEEQQTIYWKSLANGLSWNNRKFVNHADLIHLYHLMGRSQSEIVQLQNWLLQQKRSQYWGSSSETSQLIYAMLLGVEDEGIFNPVNLDIKIDGKTLVFSENEGWLSKTWLNNKGIDLKTATLEIVNTEKHPIWISGYHQYFSKISEVKAEKTDDCTLTKVFYRRKFENNVESWEKTTLEDLNVGDEIKVNVTLEIPQQLDFVYLQDYFGACFEPTTRKSGFKWDRNGSYYLNVKDQKMQFFFDHIARGKHEFEFITRVKQRGQFSNGFAEFQSYYAPEFGGHSDSRMINVNQ
ncbi:MAG: MG2 domain-containing protein [Flavobacteriales bacterium]